ncbi:MAG: LrgB family protein [Thalassotalea sp.]
MTEYLAYSLLLSILITICYKFAMKIQQVGDKVWLNPMLISMAIIIPSMQLFDYSIESFNRHSELLSMLLEPAIVALGFPLYQQIQVIKKNLNKILMLLTGAITIVLAISFILAMLVIENYEISIPIALKAITTPIGLSLTEKLAGIPSLTALTITIAGLTGAIFGQSWLNAIKVTCPRAQGLAIGCASHALATASISRVSVQHSAFASLALALSALITAIIAPVLLPFIYSFY